MACDRKAEKARERMIEDHECLTDLDRAKPSMKRIMKLIFTTGQGQKTYSE